MAADSIRSSSPLARALVLWGICVVALSGSIQRPVDAVQTDPDVLSALAVVRTRAGSGDVVAQVTLAAFLYHAGNRPEAIDWYLRAAREGHRDAQYQVGELYAQGNGLPRSEREALTWHRRAAERGSVAAQRRVGDFYRAGLGVEPNSVEAMAWYRRAADGDDVRAQYYLGDLYLNGVGVDADPGEAYVWFALAASQTPLVDNWKALVELRNTAAARLEPGERQAAERRVEAWRSSVWLAR